MSVDEISNSRPKIIVQHQRVAVCRSQWNVEKYLRIITDIFAYMLLFGLLLYIAVCTTPATAAAATSLLVTSTLPRDEMPLTRTTKHRVQQNRRHSESSQTIVRASPMSSDIFRTRLLYKTDNNGRMIASCISIVKNSEHIQFTLILKAIVL